MAAQALTLFLGSAAILFGVGAVYGVVFPGPSGEWTGLAVFAAYVVNVPIGVLGLGIGLFVRQGSPRLRRLCIAASLVVLLLPVLANLILWWRNHRVWQA